MEGRSPNYEKQSDLRWPEIASKTKGMLVELGLAAAYEQLAEEATELCHAAQKCARLVRGENPLRAVEGLRERVWEEFNDVLIQAAVLQLSPDEIILNEKIIRFWAAMREHEDRKKGREYE